MEGYNYIISLITEYCIRGIFISVFVILVFEKIFGEKLDADFGITVIKWIIITYSILSLTSFVLCFGLTEESQFTFISRMLGPYLLVYWTMFVLNSVLPFLLLYNKVGRKKILVFMISVVMNLGWLFESFIIHTTMMHRDFDNFGYKMLLPFDRELALIYRGIFIGVILLFLGNIPRVLKVILSKN